MRATIAARFGALAAAAAIAVSGGAAAANAATASPATKLPTTLTATAKPPVTHKHFTSDVIKGLLESGTTPLKFKVIWLAKQGPKGHWHLVRHERTRRNGMVRFLVRTRRTANYVLIYRGQPNFQRAVSNVITVTVTPQS
jgi:hypothetical protein